MKKLLLPLLLALALLSTGIYTPVYLFKCYQGKMDSDLITQVQLLEVNARSRGVKNFISAAELSSGKTVRLVKSGSEVTLPEVKNAFLFKISSESLDPDAYRVVEHVSVFFLSRITLGIFCLLLGSYMLLRVRSCWLARDWILLPSCKGQ